MEFWQLYAAIPQKVDLIVAYINQKEVALLCSVPVRFTLINEVKLCTRHQYLEQHFNLKQLNKLFN